MHRLAECLASLPPPQAGRELRVLLSDLQEHLLPHERDDEDALYPRLARQLAGEDPLAALSHTHREIFRLIHLLGRMGTDLSDPPTTESLADIQRVLLQLDTVLDLHFADEDELYHRLDSR